MSYPKFQAREFPQDGKKKKKEYLPDSDKICQNELGKVRMFNPSKGWGFIYAINKETKEIMDVFLHTKHFKEGEIIPKTFVGHEKNSPEEKNSPKVYVLYDLDMTNPKKPQALNVKICDELGNLINFNNNTTTSSSINSNSPRDSIYEKQKDDSIEKSVRFDEKDDDKLFISQIAHPELHHSDEEEQYYPKSQKDRYSVSYLASRRSTHCYDEDDATPMEYMPTPMNWPSYHPMFTPHARSPYPDYCGLPQIMKKMSTKTPKSSKTPKLNSQTPPPNPMGMNMMDPMGLGMGGVPPMACFPPFGMPMNHPNMYGMYGMPGMYGMGPMGPVPNMGQIPQNRQQHMKMQQQMQQQMNGINQMSMNGVMPCMPMMPNSMKLEARKSMRARKSSRKSLKSIHESEYGHQYN